MGAWLLPSKGRPGNLRRFMNAAREMGTADPIWFLINQEEWDAKRHEYEHLSVLLQPGWKFVPVPATTYGGAIRAVWEDVRNYDWIGLLSDDLVPATSNWDKLLRQGLTGWNVVSSNDGWQAPNRMHGAICWSGDLARALGWIFPAGLKHIFHDDVWETLGRETACWHTKMDVMCRHLHEALSGIKGPTMDPESDLWKHDQAWFENWKATQKDADIAKIKALMEKHHVQILKPDFNGVKVMLATPCATGRYESSYVIGMYQTLQMFQAHNVMCQWAEEKYTADIALARAKLISAFARSDCTHLLMIDDDMGWDVNAIMRLFAAKKDFVAVAGPKKRYPLQFAANKTDRNGHPIPLSMEQDTGTMEVHEVGAAFCLITRNLVQKMIAAYPELAYDGVTSEPEWALFNPMVQNRRFYSEDFAFCKRWCNIGGTVHIVPDIKLKHTGMHTFEGAFSDTWVKQPLKEAAE